MSFTNIFRGARGLSQPPIDDIESYWSPMEKAQAMRMLARSIVGTGDTVRIGIDALITDELIIVSDIYDHFARLRSFELIAEVAEASRRSQTVLMQKTRWRARRSRFLTTLRTYSQTPRGVQRSGAKARSITSLDWSLPGLRR